MALDELLKNFNAKKDDYLSFIRINSKEGNIILSVLSVEELEDGQILIDVYDSKGKYKDLQTLNLNDGSTLKVVGYKGVACRFLYTKNREY